MHRIHLHCVGMSCTEEYVAPLIPTSKMSVVFLVIVKIKYPPGMIVPQIYNCYSITLGFPQFTKWAGYLFCLKLQNPWQFAQASTSQGFATYFCKSNCSGNKSAHWLSIVCSYFHDAITELGSATETIWPTSLNYLLFGPFCQPLPLRISILRSSTVSSFFSLMPGKW